MIVITRGHTHVIPVSPNGFKPVPPADSNRWAISGANTAANIGYDSSDNGFTVSFTFPVAYTATVSIAPDATPSAGACTLQIWAWTDGPPIGLNMYKGEFEVGIGPAPNVAPPPCQNSVPSQPANQNCDCAKQGGG